MQSNKVAKLKSEQLAKLKYAKGFPNSRQHMFRSSLKSKALTSNNNDIPAFSNIKKRKRKNIINK